MKKITAMFFAFCFTFVSSQTSELQKQADELTKKVLQSQEKIRLQWLDSLATLVWQKKGFPFDSLAIETINSAIILDTVDVAAYHVVNRMYYYAGSKGDLKTSEKIFLDFKKKHLSKVKIPNRIANFYKAGGSLYYTMNQYHTALSYYDKALTAALKTTNSQAIGEIYMGKGMTFYSLGKLIEATQNLQQSIPYLKASGDENSIINVKNIMTSLYSKNGLFNQAQKERKEAIDLAKKQQHNLFLSQIYFNYSVELKNKGQLKERIKYLDSALIYVEKSKYKIYYKPIYLSGMVIAQSQLNQIGQAQHYFDLLEKEARKNAPGETTSFYKEATMRLAFAKKNYQQALTYGKDFLAYKKQIKQFDGLEEAHKFLFEVYTRLGDYKQANEHLIQFQKSIDSITGLKKSNQLTYYQTLYETEKRDTQINKQRSEIALLDAENKIKNQWLLFGGLGLLSTFVLFVLIRSRNFAKKEQKAQKIFSQRLLEEQENERKRVSKELHDGVGQNLLLIKNSLQLNPDKTPELIDKTIEEIRSISRNLHPVQLEKFGLTKALKNIVEDINELTDIFVTEEIENIDNFFPKEKEIYLYRIVQECFNNILKHSGASAAKISAVKEENKVTITIQDNGKGFNFEQNKNKKSFGLKSLQERASFLKGKINFETEVNKGTVITITSYR